MEIAPQNSKTGRKNEIVTIRPAPTSDKSILESWIQNPSSTTIPQVVISIKNLMEKRLLDEAEKYSLILAQRVHPQVAWGLLAEISILKADYEQAIDWAKRSIAISNNSIDWGVLAKAYLAAQRYEEAEDAARQSCKISRNPHSLALLIKSLLGQDQNSEALEYISELLQIDKHTGAGLAEAYRLEAHAYYQEKKWKLAAASVARSISLKPHLDSFILQAFIYQATNDTKKALHSADQIINRQPTLNALTQMCELLLALDRPEKAEFAARLCATRYQDHTAYHKVLEWLRKHDRPLILERALKRFMQFMPSPWLYLELGKIKLRNGRFLESIPILEEALVRDGNIPEAKQILVELYAGFGHLAEAEMMLADKAWAARIGARAVRRLTGILSLKSQNYDAAKANLCKYSDHEPFFSISDAYCRISEYRFSEAAASLLLAEEHLRQHLLHPWVAVRIYAGWLEIWVLQKDGLSEENKILARRARAWLSSMDKTFLASESALIKDVMEKTRSLK